ncbi:DNA helicase II [Actinomadura spongiicola]|uniref:DNA helicase II n=1 Tax=Actinomadura spongiicola TaxID=2303421 RepID=A0A372GGC3_9ACTN|nr:UvrD-helicase domain-containing protein [Actinomadura spongiicola]RFS84139.1 DNA helicase II [Actinomadura spongiicola]
MQSPKNLAVIAAAGSRKTQHIVDCVLSMPDQRALVTTYTNENLHELQNRLSAGRGLVSSHVAVMGWFSFLLSDCVKPYQSAVLGEVGIVRGLNFIGKRPQFARKDRPLTYYLDPHRAVYRDEASALAVEANRLSNGKVINRLSQIYDHIYVDEVQDMAGYDLELLELLMQSPLGVTVVGDPRQSTYSTNDSSKNKKFRGSGIADWLSKRSDLCAIEERVESYRCNQHICDFADGLYPDLPKTVAKNSEITGHDGVFSVKPSEVVAYVETYAPKVLRLNKNSDTQGLEALNFGMSKGRTYDRVLIFPTKPMIEYFRSRDPSRAGNRAALYVAATRARHSVAFVIP